MMIDVVMKIVVMKIRMPGVSLRFSVYFRRVFKKEFGMSVTEYVKAHRK